MFVLNEFTKTLNTSWRKKTLLVESNYRWCIKRILWVMQTGTSNINEWHTQNQTAWEGTAIHKKSLPNLKQKTLISTGGILSLIQSPNEKTVTLSERVWTAETIKAFHSVDVIGSIERSDGDPNCSARILPDSKITYQYAQQSNKIKYIIASSASSCPSVSHQQLQKQFLRL